MEIPGPEETCFWTGAGISRDAPSCLPLGDELTEVIVSSVCGPEVWNQLVADFAEVGMKSVSGRIKTGPRLEWVNEHLCRVVGEAPLQAFLPMANAQSNRLHRFLAEHLASGGSHITVNFDRCVEDAGASKGQRPLHLHGLLGPTDLGDIRTRTLELTSEITGRYEQGIVNALSRSELLVFLGYSGRDYFDVDPFFRALAKRRPFSLDHLRVLWIEHRDQSSQEQVDWMDAPAIDGRPILESLRTLGASVDYRRGPTAESLADLGDAWDIPVADQLPATPGPGHQAFLEWARSSIQVSPSDQIRATAVLWASMGAGGRIMELDADLAQSTDPGLHRLRQEMPGSRRAGLSGVGLYKQSIRLGMEIADPGRRHGALAGANRLRGNYARSLWHLVRALAICSGPSSTDLEYRAECGDARQSYLAWYRSARNAPGGWLIALGRRVLTSLGARKRFSALRRFDPVQVFQDFRDCRAYITEHPHAIAQVTRAWDEVPEFRATGELPDLILSQQVAVPAVYVETDHFLGYLNSERTQLIRRVLLARRMGVGSLPGEEELSRHREQAIYLNDLPGELKAALLQRVAGFTADPFPWPALRRIEWNRSTKLRWMINWARRRWWRREQCEPNLHLR